MLDLVGRPHNTADSGMLTRAALLVAVSLVAGGRGALAAPPLAGKLLRETGRWGDPRLVAPGIVRDAAISRNGRLAVVTELGIVVWDVATGQEVMREALPTPPAWPVPHIAISPDGARVTVSRNDDIRLFDVGSGRELVRVAIDGLKRPEVVLSPSGRWAAVRETDDNAPRVLELWDVAAGRRAHTLPPPSGASFGPVSFLPGEGRVLTVQTYEQFVWNLSDGAQFAREPYPRSCGVWGERCSTSTVVADGRLAVRVHPQSGTPGDPSKEPRRPLVEVLRPGTTETFTIADARPYPMRERCAPCGCDFEPRVGPEQAEVAVDRAGRRAAALITRGTDRQIEVWDLEGKVRRSVTPLAAAPAAVVLSDQGHFLATVEPEKNGHRIVVRTADDGKQRFATELLFFWERQRNFMFELDEASGLLWALAQTDADVYSPVRQKVWRLDTGLRIVDAHFGTAPRWMTLAAGGWLAVGVSYGGFDVRRSSDGAPLFAGDRQAGAVDFVAVSEDGRWLASASGDGTLAIRDLSGVVPRQTLEIGRLQKLRFVRGDRLEISEWDRVRVWDATARTVVEDRRIPVGPGHPDVCRYRQRSHAVEDRWCVTFEDPDRMVLRDTRRGTVRRFVDPGVHDGRLSPDGRTLLFTGEGRVLFVPVAPANAPTWSFQTRDLGALGGGFFPDGRHLLTVGSDQNLHLWDARARRLLDTIDFAPGMDYATSAAVSKDGRTIFVGTARGQVVRFEGAP